MPLDSDTQNADAHLIVKFYTCEKSLYAGRDFVQIMVPGDKTNVIDTLASEHYKRRFPRQWLHYQSQNDGSAFIGTPIVEWAKARPEDVSDFQLQELSILKFQTVEQVGTMSNSQAQKVGMGGVGLREKARAFLQTKNQKASSSEVEALKAQHEAEKAEMQARLAALEAKFVGEPKVAVLPVKRRGRPPRNPEV